MHQDFEKVGSPTSQSPFHHVNAQGLALRLQVMVLIRDGEDRIALAQTQKHQPGRWWIPAETLRPNEDVKEAASRVSETWFGEDLEPGLVDVLTFPANTDEGHTAWYIIHIFEVRAGSGELTSVPEGVTLEFVAPGEEAPGPFAMDHGTVWARFADTA